MGCVEAVVGTRWTPRAAADKMPTRWQAALPAFLVDDEDPRYTSMRNTVARGRKLSMMRQMPIERAHPGSGTLCALPLKFSKDNGRFRRDIFSEKWDCRIGIDEVIIPIVEIII